jgi:hypothetical protein
MTIHNFQESLADSHAYADAPWWEDVYRSAFPGVRSMVSVRDDGWAQRGGIDRLITLSCGRIIPVDEKIRKEDWPDILLERWSDEARRIAGWVQKPLACEFIAYALVPSHRCYLLPTLTLQRAWRLYGRAWCEQYKPIRAQNNGYVTLSVAIPTDILLSCVSDAMCIKWEAANNNTIKRPRPPRRSQKTTPKQLSLDV